MTTDADFLQAILEDPADDTLRLQYADYLEERGDGARAEFIRVQCELSRNEDLQKKDLSPRGGLYKMSDLVRADKLRARERELLRANTAKWAGNALKIVPDGDIIRDYLAFRRGFVASVTLPTQAFLDHAAALFQAAPIEEVRLSDLEISELASGQSMLRVASGPLRIARRFFLPLIGELSRAGVALGLGQNRSFASLEEAAAFASRACVVYGRERANLLPLSRNTT